MKKEVLWSKDQVTLLPIQWIELGQSMVPQALAFFDSGSTVTIIKKSLVESAGLDTFKVTLNLVTTGGNPEKWVTRACWVYLIDRNSKEHRIITYEMEMITIRSVATVYKKSFSVLITSPAIVLI